MLASISARPFAGAALRVKAPKRVSVRRMRGFADSRETGPDCASVQAVVRAAASARDAPYAPGSTAPAYLDGSLPGDFGAGLRVARVVGAWVATGPGAPKERVLRQRFGSRGLSAQHWSRPGLAAGRRRVS